MSFQSRVTARYPSYTIEFRYGATPDIRWIYVDGENTGFEWLEQSTIDAESDFDGLSAETHIVAAAIDNIQFHLDTEASGSDEAKRLQRERHKHGIPLP